jgi:hypothetical protein
VCVCLHAFTVSYFQNCARKSKESENETFKRETSQSQHNTNTEWNADMFVLFQFVQLRVL